MKIHSFQGSSVIAVRHDRPLPGNPAFANVIFRPQRNLAPSTVAGAGIYCILFDNRLTYLGKFQGTTGNPFGGSVIDARWTKHMATLTMRGRRVSVPNQTIAELASRHRDHPIVAGILDADRKVVSKDKGCISSLNRIRFAMQHWDAFADFNPGVLNRFQFLYGQIQPCAVSEDWIRGAVSDLERDLVAQLQPPCNGNVPAEHARHHTLEETREALKVSLSGLTRAA
jgi:hypothetical protein